MKKYVSVFKPYSTNIDMTRCTYHTGECLDENQTRLNEILHRINQVTYYMLFS